METKHPEIDIALISVHGLIRGTNPELGRDSDTGGQTLYVLELARALGEVEGVKRVTLFTRQVIDPRVDPEYGKLEESLGERVNLVRIPFGPKRYLTKESLWPYLDGFVDQMISYFKRNRRVPDIIHGHYADAGYVGSQLSRVLAIPFVFTGHSLGRVKRERLLVKKTISPEALNKKYKLPARIEAEEFSLDTASLVITSTLQEVEEQYALYENYQPDRMEVIPPGVNLERFRHLPGDIENTDIYKSIIRFLDDPTKPAILAIARADHRKNFETLIEAYGKSRELQAVANLVVIAGNRDDLRTIEPSQQRVLLNILSLIDAYDLYGKVAYPKHHDGTDIPLIYQYAAQTQGVFVNPAFTEPFGLTLIEAAAMGLPVVATNDGGPRDILGNCNNGELVDPNDATSISNALLRILTDAEKWKTYSEKGVAAVKQYYTWTNHATRYVRDMRDLYSGNRSVSFSYDKKSRLPYLERIIFTDIDNTLTGDDDALREFLDFMKSAPDSVGFAIATGRNLKKAMEVLEHYQVPHPDILITSCGTKISFGVNKVINHNWHRHIDYDWNPDRIREVLTGTEGLTLQPEEEQSHFKQSYLIDLEKAPKVAVIRRMLREAGVHAKVLLSLGMFMDIIPIRAGDDVAIRRIGLELGVPPERMLIAGDSGNDEGMLKGNTLGVVVGNYSKELEGLRKYSRVYFAKATHARGIIEGIQYYNFFDNIVIPNEF